MKQTFQVGGYTFQDLKSPEQMPRILMTRTALHSHPNSGCNPHRTRAFWVLDYTLGPAGQGRGGTEANPWRERSSQVAHLYPPETDYWEDLREVKTPFYSTFILFTGGEYLGLNPWVKNFGYARFLDPEFLLGRLLLGLAEGCAEQEERSFYFAQAKLFEIAALLQDAVLLQAETAEIGRTTGKTSFSRTIDEFLKQRFQDKLTLRQIARELKVSPSTLSHRYTEETGMSPIRKLIEIRIEHSRALLTKGGGVKEIAAQSGFDDPYHFSKTFSRLVGISPREYARSGGLGM